MARIVIVDDDELFTELATGWLEQEDHMVSAVHHGDDALPAFRDSEPDLVILDYDLPGRSGLDILRTIRALPRGAKVPVLMLTAKNGRLLECRATAEGVDDYIQKPVTCAEMSRRVGALLAL